MTQSQSKVCKEDISQVHIMCRVMETRYSPIIFSTLKVALSAQALCLLGIIAALCVTQFQGDYLVYYFEASKKWSNIVNFIPNLIKNTEFNYRFEVQKREILRRVNYYCLFLGNHETLLTTQLGDYQKILEILRQTYSSRHN